MVDHKRIDPVSVTNTDPIPTELYFNDGFGQQPVNSSNPLPVAGSVSISNNELLGYVGTPATSISGVGQSHLAITPGTYQMGMAAAFYFGLAFASTHTVAFEESNDFTNWRPSQAFEVPTSNPQLVSSATGSSSTRTFVIPIWCGGLTYRARCTAFSGSTFTIVSRVVPLAFNNQVFPLPSGNNTIGKVLQAGSLIPFDHDFIDLNYSGSDLTQVIFKSGGSSGTTVATLTLTYSGGKLDTITRT